MSVLGFAVLTADKARALRLARRAKHLRQVADAARTLVWQATTAELADPTPSTRHAANLSRQAELAWARIAFAAETNAKNADEAIRTRHQS